MIPLSFAQRRLWFLDRFEGPSAIYNIPFLVRLTGKLDVLALSSALRDVVVRHESLRTVFVEDADGTPAQRPVPLDELRWEVPVADVAPGAVPDAVAEAASYVFDLGAEIPVRARLLRCGPQEHVLVLIVHHTAADGESMVPLARDLAAAYTARLEGGTRTGRSWRSSTATTPCGSGSSSVTRTTPRVCCPRNWTTGRASWRGRRSRRSCPSTTPGRPWRATAAVWSSSRWTPPSRPRWRSWPVTTV